MIEGVVALRGDSVQPILYKHIFEEAPGTSQARAGIPLFLSDAIARALAKEPDQRFATMEDFATAVWPEQPVAAPRSGKGGAPATRARRKAGVTSESPTEAVSSAAPTTPMPVARPAGRPGTPPPPPTGPKKSKAGLLVAVTGLAAVGIGEYWGFPGGHEAPPPSPPAPPV